MWSIIIFAGRSAVQVGFSILLYQHYPNNPYNIAYIYPIFMVAELIVAALVITLLPLTLAISRRKSDKKPKKVNFQYVFFRKHSQNQTTFLLNVQLI